MTPEEESIVVVPQVIWCGTGQVAQPFVSNRPNTERRAGEKLDLWWLN